MRALGWLRDLLDGEPVATRIGPAGVLIVGYLVTRGVLDGDTAQLIAALVAILLGGGTIAAARALVTPVPKRHD
uniref:hypothetical protein n=1 Tax=Nocardia suismassiliense TaxID=2077092 RepID=UPI003F499019